MSVVIRVGDCLEVLPTLEAESVDAVVTDPPYGLRFMGKAWDHGVPGVPFWTEARRVMKPGSYLLAFGGTRTFHRLAVAIEDAGFEIQDCLSWLYGSGFPKHKSKLKPAWEPIIMARKPAPKATHLNIDACRITGGPSVGGANSGRKGTREVVGGFGYKRAAIDRELSAGRWPANVVLDEEAGAMLDEQSGVRPSTLTASGGKDYTSAVVTNGGLFGRREQGQLYGDIGGASRFFYTAKAGRSEREEGLDGLRVRRAGMMQDDGYEWPGTPEHSPHRTPPARNHHPTVKPLDLMRWLVRLVTPPNGVVLDPFMGSGSTGCAAVLEAKRFIGIEREAEYCEIARRRIAHHGAQGILPFAGISGDWK